MLLNDTTIDKHFKPEILKKISAGIMTKKLAQTIASNQFDVDKVYVERAWEFLDNTENICCLFIIYKCIVLQKSRDY